MGLRTPEQLDVILHNSKVNMLDSVMDLAQLRTSFNPPMEELYSKWIKQSQLIYLLENIFSTDDQKQQAADELGRLNYDRALYSAYWSPNYSSLDYAQNQNPPNSTAPTNDSFPYTLPFSLA